MLVVRCVMNWEVAMRKWLCNALFSTSIVALSVTSVMARGIFITPGARANSFGTAFHAIADDASAIYWNPAGLAQQEKGAVEASLWYEANPAKSSRSLGNAAIPNTKGGDFAFPNIFTALEPTMYNSNEVETSAMLPSIAGYGKVKDYTIGGGMYGLGGGGGKWKSTVTDVTGVDTIDASLTAQRGVFIVYNVSAARKVLPKLSVGAGIDMITYSDKLEVRKDYFRGTGSLAPANYGLFQKDTASGSGLQINAGAIYAFQDNLKAGLVIRSGSTLKIKGTTRFTRSGLALLGSPDVDLSSDYDKNYYYPMQIGGSVAYDPSKKVTVAAGFEWVDYTGMKNDITYKNPQGVFTSVNASMDWKAVTRVLVGGEYRHSDKLHFNAGIYNDPTPYSRDQVSLLDTSQYDFIYYCLGAGYNFGAVDVTLVYHYTQSEKISKNGATYEFPMANMWRLGVRYKFL